MAKTTFKIFAVFTVSLLAFSACSKKSDDSETKDAAGPDENATVATASEASAADEDSPAHPIATKVYWGDTHLHTWDSPDAFAAGATLGPEEALRFAMGEEVESTTGLKARLDRPLDFLVIADHAVGLGLTREIARGNERLLQDPRVAEWNRMMNSGPEGQRMAARELIDGHTEGTNPAALSDLSIVVPIMSSVWRARGELVDRYNVPGTFTALHGYEFTPTPNGDNLHRVVIFRDSADKTNAILPFTSAQSEDPKDLWQSLAAYEAATGGKALAIPHNPNLSNGQMFAFTDFEGAAIDAEYASERARWEPLVEATQIKGDSESHPLLSPNDEFAAFGDAGWEGGNLTKSITVTKEIHGGNYIREALKRGLAIEAETGVNPFKLGMIGSTDSHTALATADEDNFYGKFILDEPSADRATTRIPLGADDYRIGWQYLASGYAAVWASENTREAIFDAMMRKEVYATTGPRIQLRFFGGWDYEPGDADGADIAKAGYAGGIPMGADLPAAGGDGAPTFLVSALKDPEGANLDRVQIVKGWTNADGELQEKIFNVSWAGERTLEPNGKLPPVGDTVNLETATYSNNIGAASLKSAWVDPEFDADVASFYYVRVLEIPTPRWTAFDVARFGAEMPEGAILKHQERAYSSPIWYTPPGAQ